MIEARLQLWRTGTPPCLGRERSSVRRLPRLSHKEKIMTMPRLAVLGSGLMGIGIAVHLARHGHAVRLQDVDPSRLAEVTATARTLLAELEEADIAVDTEAVVARLTTTTELADLADCDLLFEAVPERLELKHRLYAQLEAVLRPDVLIASNTSGLPPDELAAHLHDLDRLLIAHCWNRPHVPCG